MAGEKIARLRQQSEHCRRMALGLNDYTAISALLKLAQEYDETADQMEAKPTQNPLGG